MQYLQLVNILPYVHVHAHIHVNMSAHEWIKGSWKEYGGFVHQSEFGALARRLEWHSSSSSLTVIRFGHLVKTQGHRCSWQSWWTGSNWHAHSTVVILRMAAVHSCEGGRVQTSQSLPVWVVHTGTSLVKTTDPAAMHRLSWTARPYLSLHPQSTESVWKTWPGCWRNGRPTSGVWGFAVGYLMWNAGIGFD